MALHIQDTVDILPPQYAQVNGSSLNGTQTEPYPAKICFYPLIEFLRERAQTAVGAEKLLIESTLDTFENTPGFECTFDDKEDLEPYQDLVKMLLAGLFPLTTRTKLLAMVSKPLTHDPFYVSEQMEKMLGEGTVVTHISKEVAQEISMKHIWAGIHILNTLYGQDIHHKPRFFFKMRPAKGKTERYYMSNLNFDFIQVKLLKEKPELSKKDIQNLLNNISDKRLWDELLPRDTFEFRGINIGQITDITEEEAISYLKQKLLEKDALTNPDKIKDLENEMRIMLDNNQLHLGLTAIDYPTPQILHRYKIRHDFLADQEELLKKAFDGSVYDRACAAGEPLMISDLRDMKNKTPLEEELINRGYRSIIVFPLKKDNGRIIGLMEIGSERENCFNSFTLHKLRKVTGLFDLAMERSREEIDNKIEAVIREEYTTLHSSVEWKFIEHAYDLMNQRESNDNENLQALPIRFPNVYPLYGQADIVGSSVIRNESIQLDLLENLRAVQDVLLFAEKRTAFPLTELHLQEVKELIVRLTDALRSSDESEIVDFLHKKIHPYFEFLRNSDKMLRRINLYFKKLDPKFNIIYDKRKNYETSVSMLNKKIGRYLEKQQIDAQKIVPHYYEKYATDGVEFEIYAGQSISHKINFTDLHISNLRLWQLETLCEVTRIVADLQKDLPVPLTTAQMIFVYSLPVSIRFLLDEKHFDVDGAYNVRYKILKKRIDKAVIRGTEERITQAGKVAVVYTTERDRLEYLGYAKYLLEKGEITADIEETELGALQGVDGLRALRLTVA